MVPISLIILYFDADFTLSFNDSEFYGIKILLMAETVPTNFTERVKIFDRSRSLHLSVI